MKAVLKARHAPSMTDLHHLHASKTRIAGVLSGTPVQDLLPRARATQLADARIQGRLTLYIVSYKGD